MSESRSPFPPFTLETAIQKIQAAQNAWNTRDAQHVAAAYTVDSHWRNRDEHIIVRGQIVEFLIRKWQRELDYALRKSLWAFREDRIARMARRQRPVVPQLRQRIMAVHAVRFDVATRSKHQRPCD